MCGKYTCRILVSLILMVCAYIFLRMKQIEDEVLVKRLQQAIGTVPPQIQEDLALLQKKYMELELEGNIKMQVLYVG